jgi:hypothetical protein
VSGSIDIWMRATRLVEELGMVSSFIL